MPQLGSTLPQGTNQLLGQTGLIQSEMATLQEVPPNAVKAFGMVDDWNTTFQIIVEEQFYVVEKVYRVDDRVREIMLKGNAPLGTDDFQDRNEGAMAALVCGRRAYIGRRTRQGPRTWSAWTRSNNG